MRNFILSILLVIASFSLYAQQDRILFIGNSYTYVNDLPSMVKNIYDSFDESVECVSSTAGGATFNQHCYLSLSAIQQGDWNYVVLQEQSQLPSFPDAQFVQESYPYAQQLCSLINEYSPDSHIVFYMTWGRKNGDASNCQNFPPLCTYEGMDSLLNLRYMMMAEDNHTLVAPVGAVWHYIRQHNPEIELYQSDESHPSYVGSYAAACCFYTIFKNRNPELIHWNGELDDNISNIVKTAVKTIVFDSLQLYNFEEVTDDDSTGIFHYPENSINIFPNPAKNTISVKFSDEFIPSSVAIYDIYGKTVQFDNNFNSENIDVSSLNNGIYILEFKSDSFIIRKKISVIR